MRVCVQDSNIRSYEYLKISRYGYTWSLFLLITCNENCFTITHYSSINSAIIWNKVMAAWLLFFLFSLSLIVVIFDAAWPEPLTATFSAAQVNTFSYCYNTLSTEKAICESYKNQFSRYIYFILSLKTLTITKMEDPDMDWRIILK